MVAFLVLSTLVIWGMFATTGLWLGFFFPSLARYSPAVISPLILTAFILLGITLTRTHYNWITGLLYYVTYILFGLAFIAFCVVAAAAVLFMVLKWMHVPARTHLGIISVALMGVLWVVALWGGFKAPLVKRIAISSPELPSLKIALISDSHLGLGVSYRRWDQALSRIEQEKPDLILVLGDVFEYGPNAARYAARLARVKTPLGTYGVLGNHEYYNGLQASFDFFKQANITLLQNETISLPDGLQITGLKDIKTTRLSAAEMEGILQRADKTRPLILLSHTPLHAHEAAHNGVNLMLSGHTHNGQIWPFNYLVRLQYPYVYGLFDISGMPFYVTSGMFYWGIPLRLFAPSEIPILEVNL